MTNEQVLIAAPASPEPAGVSGVRPPKNITLTSDMHTAWKQWIQQFEWYAIATQLNKKPAEVQAATLMTSLGPDIINIYNSFNLSSNEAKDIKIIKQRFEAHFNPTLNVSFERFNFFKATQNDDESFDDFLTRMKTLAKTCKFETLEDGLIKDKIIFGIKANQVREKLLTESELTLEKATSICRASEQASKQIKEIENSSTSSVLAFKKSQESDNKSDKKFKCKRCGKTHKPRSCPAYNKTCEKCKKKNHFASQCATKIDNETKSKQNKKVDALNDDSDEELFVYQVTTKNEDDWAEVIQVGNVKFKVKLDTGAQCNVLPVNLVNKVNGNITKSNTRQLISYTGDKIPVAGQTELKCRMKKLNATISFKVVKENVCPVLGRKSCEQLGLIARIRSLESQQDDEIFKGLGCLKNYEYDIDLIDNPKFVIKPARRIPYAIRDKVKQELDKMVHMQVIKPVKEPTPAVSPMVIIKNKKGIRICIDPSDVNKNLKRRHYPLKTIEEIAAKISGSRYFTLLDLRRGFWQIKISERTQKYLTFATPWGRYSCLRLPFGVASAPEVFQGIMSDLLKDIENVEVAMDDILIHAPTKEKLREVTQKVMKTLTQAGLKLHKEKCEFEATKLKFLGHIVSANGLEVNPERIEGIKLLKTPKSKAEIQRLLGMVTYLNKFIPNMSKVTEPLRILLKKENIFKWEIEQEKAFNEIKEILTNAPVLKLYDVKAPVVISTDASSRSIGAVLMQEGHPVAYATKALTDTEENYPPIEKEALAIRFSCKKFHEYVCGKDLTVETDHKPLESIFKKTLDAAPSRLRRIMFDVSQYHPKIVHVPGKKVPIADTLSRDCENKLEKENEKETLEVMLTIAMSKEATKELVKATAEDKEMQLLIQYINNGFPEDLKNWPADIKHYFNFKEELAYYDGVIFKGNKIIVPQQMISKMLKAIHTGHFGIQSCLRRARQSLYWKGQYSDILEMVKNCHICEKTQRSKDKEEVLTREIPTLPWQLVASDVMFFEQKPYIVITDSYSNYVDFKKLKSQTSAEIIEHLKNWFYIHGVPEVFETDNDMPYISKEFEEFAKTWSFDRRTSSPLHSQGNGLAERAVQIAKNILRKCSQDNTDYRLALLNWNNIPRDQSLGSPYQRLYGRITRSTIPTTDQHLKPRLVEGVSDRLKVLRDEQACYANRTTKPAERFQLGDQVRMRESHRNWSTGKIVEKLENNPRSIVVKLDDGRTYRRNSSRVHKTPASIPVTKELVMHSPVKVSRPPQDPISSGEAYVKQNNPLPSENSEPSSPGPRDTNSSSNSKARDSNSTAPPPTNPTRTSRYGRVIKQTQRLNL